MSTSAQFFCNLPVEKTFREFIEGLVGDVGLNINPIDDKEWEGNYNGLELQIVTEHGMENDLDLEFGIYEVMFSLSGSADHGNLKIITVPSIICLALAVAINLKVEGFITYELQKYILGIDGRDGILINSSSGEMLHKVEDLVGVMKYGPTF